jgi:molybdenum cofactor cytidylyltransferase
MKFGPVPVSDALGAILAHSVRLDGGDLKKGRTLVADDLEALHEAGITEVLAARLEPDDVPEDEAAAHLARALLAPGIRIADAFTGRANLFAEEAGVLTLDRAAIDAVNRADEAITIATLPSFAAVTEGQMLATVKIIPFAAPSEALAEAIRLLQANAPALRLHPYRPLTGRLIQTTLPGTSAKMLDKTVRITEERMTAIGGTLDSETRCAHDADALAAEITAAMRHHPDLLLIAGASAITDRRDALPAGIEKAEGRIEHFGMPVDPGNLLLLAWHGRTPVLGLPGCARSPKLNGFDWVLQRLAADIPVDRAAIMAMGVGGLLTEIPTRPQPRARKRAQKERPRIAILILAAGQSRRMGKTNKLLVPVDGKPLLRHTVEAALASNASDTLIVTGHERHAVEALLDGTAVRTTHNPDYAAGLSTSLKAGIAALPPGTDAAIVCLGDMPEIDSQLLDRLIDAFDPGQGRSIIVPTHNGKRGNPVLWSSAFFPAMAGLEGDVGARHLIGQHQEAVVEVPMATEASLLDIDTPEALDAYLARPAR